MNEKIENRIFDLTLTGEPSLDFANTVDWRTSAQPKELLESYSDFVRWARHTNLINSREAEILAEEATRRPQYAGRALARALELRETIFRVFSAVAHEKKPDLPDFMRLNRELNDALSHLRVEQAENVFVWKWTTEAKSFERLIWEVARSAGEFLTSERIKNLRECGGAGCAWLFVDTSRNKSRRWCMMGICGNRAKVKRHYQQSRSSKKIV